MKGSELKNLSVHNKIVDVLAKDADYFLTDFVLDRYNFHFFMIAFGEDAVYNLLKERGNLDLTCKWSYCSVCIEPICKQCKRAQIRRFFNKH